MNSWLIQIQKQTLYVKIISVTFIFFKLKSVKQHIILLKNSKITTLESLQFNVAQFLGIPRPQIYILNGTISRIKIEHVNDKKNGM